MVLVWLDWLVFCHYGFSVSTLWCPLATPTILLGFLFPWVWDISSRLLQQSTATAPYLGRGVSPYCCHSWPSKWDSGFPYFLQFKSEFGNKEFMIWAIVSFTSCFCWLYRASPSLVAENINQSDSVLTIWWCPCVESSLMFWKEGVCYGKCVLLAKLY